MRIRMIQPPSDSNIDGVRLSTFECGRQYDVNSALGLYLIANGWANPVTSDEPAILVPLADFETGDDRDDDTPVNLKREFFPPYYDGPAALVLDRRRRPRRPS